MVFAEQNEHLEQIAIHCVEFLYGVCHFAHLVGQYGCHILYYFDQRNDVELPYGVEVFPLDDLLDDLVALVGQAVEEDHFDEVDDEDVYALQLDERVVVGLDGDAQEQQVPHQLLSDFGVRDRLAEVEMGFAVSPQGFLV